MARPCLTHGRHSSAFHQAMYITQCLASALLFLWFLVSLRAHTVMSAVLPPFCNTSAQWLDFMALCYSLCCFDLPPLVYNSRIHFFSRLEYTHGKLSTAWKEGWHVAHSYTWPKGPGTVEDKIHKPRELEIIGFKYPKAGSPCQTALATVWFYFYYLYFFFKTGFLCVTLAVLKLAL